MDATLVTFQHNGGGTSNTIYGYYIVNTDTNKVRKAERFDSPVSMAAAWNSIELTDKQLVAGTIT